MTPEDIALLRVPSSPLVLKDGSVVIALTSPDPVTDRYSGVLVLVRPDGEMVDLTLGPRDSSPLLSPGGHTLLFLRAAENGPAQLHSIDLRGGEARRWTTHRLGVKAVAISPDGRQVAYRAPVPEVGRYGDDPDVGPDAEPPRAIGQLSYRRDGEGFLLDRPDQVFVLQLVAGAQPRQLTQDPLIVGGPVFLPDGRLGYLRTVAPDRPQCEIVAIGVGSPVTDEADTAPDHAPDGVAAVGVMAAGVLPSASVAAQVLCRIAGSATQLVVAGDDLLYLGAEFEDQDSAGRTAGLWSVPTTGGTACRLTDVEVEVDTGVPPVAVGQVVLVCVSDRGSVGLRAVRAGARSAPLTELAEVVGGQRVVTGFSVRQVGEGGATVAAVVADPSTPGELVVVELTADGHPADAGRPLTNLAVELRTSGLAEQIEISGAAPDGYPVHGFLVVPQGPGPHPVLLVVHGGPHAAYGWGLFDEAQVYAGAGYAVVLPNPRGSSGYGHEHGRTVLRRLGTVDVDDVLALLDAALERPDLDTARVGVMGGSYGGFMTSWLAARSPERFTAAISERAVNAWDSFAGSSDIGYYFADQYVGPDRADQWAASPLSAADRIALPLLIVHSEQDWRCPVEQAQRLYVALSRRGAPVELLLFPGEGHELSRSGRPRHRLQRFEHILRWWDRHLPVAAPA